MMSARFTYTDKSAAVIYKFFDCGNDFFICPVFAAALRCVCIAYIDDNINIIKQVFIFFYIVKGAPLNASITPKYE